jgi:hypothetical protein
LPGVNPEVPDEQRHLTAVVDAMNRSMVQRLAHEHAARLAQEHESTGRPRSFV